MPKTAATLFRIVAILLALVAVLDLAIAYDAHRSGERAAPYIKQAVMNASVCVVFFSVAHIRKRRATPSGEETDSPQSK